MNNKLTSQEAYSHYNNNSITLELLYKAFREYGIPNPTHIKNSGFTRWGKNDRYWLTPYREGYCFGDFVDDFKSCVFPKHWYNNQRNWNKIPQDIDKIVQAQKLEDEEHEKIACFASQIWERAKPCEDHPYLQKKGIKSYSLKVSDDGRLIIPLFAYDNKISTLQYINADGEKRFLKGEKKQGSFYPIGELQNRILFCEGYATGCSIYEATNELTICCLDAGNLIHVAEKFRDYYPNIEMIICADNDSYKEKNVGIEEAKETGLTVNAVVVFPVFKDTTTNPTDFNDLHGLEGIEAVRKQIIPAFENGGNYNGNGGNCSAE